MKRVEEELPEGAAPAYDMDRGQEAVFVTADLRFGTWRAPYCGPRSLRLPKFRATRAELQQLEREIAARVPPGSLLRVARASPPDADGREEWAMGAFAEHSTHNLEG